MTTQWNFADLWEAIADRHPDAVAQECDERSYSWRDFDRRADGIASVILGAGLGPQSKVAQYLYNGPEYLESVFACFKAALVPVNTNYRYLDAELRYLWDNADVEAVIFHGDNVDRCERLRLELPAIRLWLFVGSLDQCPRWATPYEAAASSPPPTRVAPCRSGQDVFLLYTGGTTGMPKGVMWPQHELALMLDGQGGGRLNASGSIDEYVSKLDRPGPRVLPAAPLMHGTALWFAMSALQVAGAVITTSDRAFVARDLINSVRSRSIKGICIVGDAFARPIVSELDTTPSTLQLDGLRVVMSSGAMFSPEVKAALLHHAPNALIIDALGSSESGTVGRSMTTQDDLAELGRFRVNEHVRVVDENGGPVEPGSGQAGRLAVGGNIPLGYYKDEEKTAATFQWIDGRRFVIAGDWAEVERDGTVRLLGRGSGCINTGGEKVFPEEVEEALKLSVGVADVCVVGVPDQRFGQRVVAVVQPERGAELDPDKMMAEARTRLAAYKTPRAIFTVDDLGRGPNGKLDYRRIGELARHRSGG